MSWAKLLADNRVTALPPSKAELDNLRSIVARSRKTMESAPGLSADARFVMVYDAAPDVIAAHRAGGRLSAAHGGRGTTK